MHTSRFVRQDTEDQSRTGSYELIIVDQETILLFCPVGAHVSLEIFFFFVWFSILSFVIRNRLIAPVKRLPIKYIQDVCEQYSDNDQMS